MVEDGVFWGGWLVFWGFFLGWGPRRMETNKYRIQRRMFRNQCGRGIFPYVTCLIRNVTYLCGRLIFRLDEFFFGAGSVVQH